MIVGCYDLHLYCDGHDCEAGPYRQRSEYEATDEYGSKCRKLARRAGWKLTKTQHALCPSCVKRGAPLDPKSF